MRKLSIYLVTKLLPERLHFVNQETQTEIHQLEICKTIATGYKAKVESGAEVYVPFSKLDTCPVTPDMDNLQLTAIVQAFNEKEALEIAEEKMQSFIEKWCEHLREKENEEQKETPERW